MEEDFLWVVGKELAQMRLLIEGAIVLYEEELPKLLHTAVQKEQYDTPGALDTIGTAIYDLRTHIRALQAAQTKEVIRTSEQNL